MNTIHQVKDSAQRPGDVQVLPSIARPCPQIQPIACHLIPDVASLNQKADLLDLDVITTHMLHEGRLTSWQIHKILADAERFLELEPNIVPINSKCYVFGDIHGQFYDLVSVMNLLDLERETVLFLGDYVDRGAFSTETYLFLMLLKAHYPNNIFILRGNHESEKMTSYFTFKAECIAKYDNTTYKRFVKSFEHLPLAAVIQNMAFCAHGGISPHIKKLSDVNRINRFCEVPYSGMFCDLLWSDPHENYDLGIGKSWEPNNRRRCSVKYTYENVKNFLDQHGLSLIIRAHEVQEAGYCMMKPYKGHPSVITLFSAPCYCDTYTNDGAYLLFDKGVKEIRTYKAVEHPFVINGFFDGINWSLPFISEKLVEFTAAVCKELDREDVIDKTDKLVSNMVLMRTEREAIDEFEKDDGVDCQLQTEATTLPFGEAIEKDAENEVKKEDEAQGKKAGETAKTISPSLQNANVEKAVRKLGKDEPVAGNVAIKIDETSTKIVIQKKEPWFFKYVCWK